MTADKKINLVMDYDGTLHDSRAIYEPAFRRAMLDIEKSGWIEHKEYTSEEIVYWVGFSAREMWHRFHPELSEEQRSHASKLIGSYMCEALENGMAKLYPGTEEIMDALSHSYRLIFLSNCDRGYMETHKKIFGLDRWFEAFYCTGDYDYAPKEEIFSRYIFEAGNVYVAVGDRIKDITLAKSSGIRGVGCLYGFGSKEELSGADILIEDVSELSQALEELKKF